VIRVDIDAVVIRARCEQAARPRPAIVLLATVSIAVTGPRRTSGH
jgi:hypothetical protein